ncbi:MAG: GIY-YIG nuclease family protein [Dehalococcoidia bacterium]
MKEQFYVYIVCNKNNSALYTGVTSDLVKRVSEHRAKLADGFSKRYNLDKLVYYEVAGNAEAAILREKQIKAGPRRKKIELIEDVNPLWRDLYPDL